jgi:hypothetical protein
MSFTIQPTKGKPQTRDRDRARGADTRFALANEAWVVDGAVIGPAPSRFLESREKAV